MNIKLINATQKLHPGQQQIEQVAQQVFLNTIHNVEMTIIIIGIRRINKINIAENFGNNSIGESSY